jgi:hypothetical protein
VKLKPSSSIGDYSHGPEYLHYDALKIFFYPEGGGDRLAHICQITRRHIKQNGDLLFVKFPRKDHAENLLLTEDVGLNLINVFNMNRNLLQ